VASGNEGTLTYDGVEVFASRVGYQVSLTRRIEWKSRIVRCGLSVVEEGIIMETEARSGLSKGEEEEEQARALWSTLGVERSTERTPTRNGFIGRGSHTIQTVHTAVTGTSAPRVVHRPRRHHV
jgi:hypothetical protein